MPLSRSFLAVILLPLAADAQGPVSPASLQGFQGMALCVAVSPDGKLIAVGGQEKTITLWDGGRGDTMVLNGIGGPIMSLAFGGAKEMRTDGQSQTFVVAVSGKWARLWDTKVGAGKSLELKVNNDSDDRGGDILTCVAATDDGRWVAAAGWDGKVRLWNAKDGKVETVIPAEQGPIFSLAFSPDGKWLASGGRNGTAKIWDVAQKKLQSTLGDHGKTVWSVAWTSNGEFLAAPAGNDVKIWRVADAKVVAHLKGHTAPVRSLSFTANDMKLVTGSEDKTVHAWDLPARSAEGMAREIDQALDMSIATQLRGKEEERRQAQPLYEKGFISGADWAALGTEITRLKSARKGAEFHELTSGPVYSIAAAPDSKLIVAAVKDPANSVHIWKIGKD